MKILLPSIRITIFLTLIFGLIYPLLITGVANVFFSDSANGSFLSRGGEAIGSYWIGQKFEKPEYFWPRPSAVDYNPLSSGGSNMGQASADLKKVVDERKAKLVAAHPNKGQPPQELLFASGSGLDPHISPVAALYQVERVAQARQLKLEQVTTLIEQSTLKRQLGIFGEPTVNVLALNLALDHAQGISTPPTPAPPAVNSPATP